ncbi:MAG: 3'(2'),5'-bisphosphate nucleotidase CysQ [Alphaproteobacteria bacterium]|nr:3'(2'),5'-bisphosphate nucleotidase CysQ [Alphaproteobacteria bacterium]
MLASEDIAIDADLLFATVREAGELGRELRRKGVRQWSKPDGSEVTEADIRLDTLLKERLTAARPTYGWLSEETPDGPARLSHDIIWIADPIDGTRAFVKGETEWCVGGALVYRGRPVAAAVYRPMVDEFYTAIAGRGAFRDGAQLTVPDSESLEGAQIAGNRKALGALSDTGIAGDPSGNLPLLLRLAFVAAGRIDGAVSIGNRKDWDLAAGELLVLEAGGQVSDASGQGFVYNRPEPWQQGLVAAGAKRHAALVNALRSP